MCSRELKHCSASDPGLRALLPLNQMAYCSTKISFTRYSRRTSVCANIGATLNHSNVGRGPSRIGFGGSSFCETLEVPAFGTNSILFVTVSKRCTSIPRNQLAFCDLQLRYRQKVASFRLGSGWAAAERLRRQRRTPKRSYSNPL